MQSTDAQFLPLPLNEGGMSVSFMAEYTVLRVAVKPPEAPFCIYYSFYFASVKVMIVETYLLNNPILDSPHRYGECLRLVPVLQSVILFAYQRNPAQYRLNGA